MKKKVVLLVGSPKLEGGNSDLLGRYLLKQLDNETIETQIIRVSQALQSAEKTREMTKKAATADWLVLSFPNYMSSPPALMIETMDLIYSDFQKTPSDKQQKLMAICSGGYPGTASLETALEICRLYAKETGLRWMGGIGIAGTAVLEDKSGGDPASHSLEKAGFMAKKMMKALDLGAAAVIKEEPLATTGRYQLIKLPIPDWMYAMIGNRTFQAMAKEHNSQERLFEKPYAEPSQLYPE